MLFLAPYAYLELPFVAMAVVAMAPVYMLVVLNLLVLGVLSADDNWSDWNTGRATY